MTGFGVPSLTAGLSSAETEGALGITRPLSNHEQRLSLPAGSSAPLLQRMLATDRTPWALLHAGQKTGESQKGQGLCSSLLIQSGSARKMVLSVGL